MADNETTSDEFDRLLDDFIAQQLADTETTAEENKEAVSAHKPLPPVTLPEDQAAETLYPEERRLYDAFRNFRQAVSEVAGLAGLAAPKYTFAADQIYPRFRPGRIDNLYADIFISWECLVTAQPVRLSSLPPNPTDEQLLSFAEKTTDPNLQNAIISYVEVLIELDGCEIAYNLRKAKAQKRKIERKLYEEHLHRQEKIKLYIEAIRQQNFPVDAERLVNNFFKTARKDPNGAQAILENNPATYAPIQTDKIPPRFFGLIKAKPEDGIRVNKELGKFLKHLKA